MHETTEIPPTLKPMAERSKSDRPARSTRFLKVSKKPLRWQTWKIRSPDTRNHFSEMLASMQAVTIND
jgi:hypothetical protein